MIFAASGNCTANRYTGFACHAIMTCVTWLLRFHVFVEKMTFAILNQLHDLVDSHDSVDSLGLGLVGQGIDCARVPPVVELQQGCDSEAPCLHKNHVLFVFV